MKLSDSDIENYNHIRSGGAGFIELPRGLIAVWGKEAVQFLDGLITNDVKTLGDGQQMLAAFPNAQGRLLAVVRVLRHGDRFLFETEDATREKLYNNLFRFTFAGDFFVEDLSDQFSFVEIVGSPAFELAAFDQVEFRDEAFATFRNPRGGGFGVFVPSTAVREDFLKGVRAPRVSREVYETLRIESGMPKYGVDMDENTIVPELGLDGMISYTKGCYIGQEIIARIHFRGHVAKQLTGLVSEPGATVSGFSPGAEVTSPEGKNAGRMTSVVYSSKLDRFVALAYVRYDFLAPDTQLRAAADDCIVSGIPFIDR